MKTNIRKVALSCGHTLSFAHTSPPKRGEEVWCYRCSDYTFVGLTDVEQFKVKCDHCPYSRMYGVEKHLAGMAVTKHMAKYPHHLAHVVPIGGNRIGTRTT